MNHPPQKLQGRLFTARWTRAPQAFYAGVSRHREIDHDASLHATYRREEARLRDEHGNLDVRRVILEQDLKRAYQEFCKSTKVHFVVVHNLTRFARERYDHFALRAHLKSLGISLRSATKPIDDTSTGKLMEGELAAFAQFDNDVRSETARALECARRLNSGWTFPARPPSSVN